MKAETRLYTEATDKEWSSRVYQAAKPVIEEVLVAASTPVPRRQILEVMQRKHPELCDDMIKDRQAPKAPYWPHLVSSAIDITTESFQILSFVEGNGSLLFQGSEGGDGSRIAFVPGDTVLIPASLSAYTITPKSQTRFLLTKPV